MSTRRALLRAAAALPLAGHGALRAADVPLPQARSLDRELRAALARRQALVVLASLHGCPYCRRVRESHLGPLHLADSQPVVQVDIDSDAPLADPAGVPTTHRALAARWGVRVAPTVLFLGPGGREVAPRLVGAGLPDFYGAYLDERLAQANRAAG